MFLNPSASGLSDENFEGTRADRWFQITQRRSTLSTELLAGTANFLANSYLLVLVPELLANVGVDRKASLFGFVLSTFFASVFVVVQHMDKIVVDALDDTFEPSVRPVHSNAPLCTNSFGQSNRV